MMLSGASTCISYAFVNLLNVTAWKKTGLQKLVVLAVMQKHRPFLKLVPYTFVTPEILNWNELGLILVQSVNQIKLLPFFGLFDISPIIRNCCGLMKQSTRAELDGKMLEIITAVEDQNTREAIRELAVRFKEKSESDEKSFAKFEILKQDINERPREQKRYLSKDTVIIKNLPFDARDLTNLFVNIQKFFKEFLKNWCLWVGAKSLSYYSLSHWAAW